MPGFNEFYNAVHSLLPTGTIWSEAQELNVLNILTESITQDLKIANDIAARELDDSFPDSTFPGNYVSDWERVLGLPKTYTDRTYFQAGVNAAGDPLSVATEKSYNPTTIATRVAVILAMLQSSAFNNAQFYIDICAALGFTVTVVTVGPAEWRLTVTAGDLANIDGLIATVKFFSPFHTFVEIIY